MNRLKPFIFLLGFSLFCSFDSQEDNTSIETLIQECLDSAGKYFTFNDGRRQMWIDKALSLASENKLWRKYIEIHRYHQLPYLIYYSKSREWKQELLLIDSLIAAHREYLGDQANVLANSNQTQWGIYHSYFGSDQEAIDLLKRSINELERLPVDSANAYNLHYNSIWLASFYKKIGSYEASIQENLRSLILLDQYKQFISNPRRLSNAGIYAAIAHAYLLLADTTHALEFYQKSEKDLEDFLRHSAAPQMAKGLVFNVYTGVANYYRQTQQYDKSLASLLRIKSHLEPKDPFFAKNLIGIADIHLFNREFDQALQVYREAENRVKDQHGITNYRMAEVNLKLAQLYEAQEKWEDALIYYQKAIANVTLDFPESHGYLTNPDRITPSRILGRTELLQALDGKTALLLKLYDKQKNIALLKSARKSSDLSVALIDSIKNDLFLDQDRQFQVADQYRVYEKGLVIADHLYALTGDAGQIGKIVKLAERSKSLGLLARFQPDFRENPETAARVERERQLKYEIAKREEALINKGYPPQEDSLYLALQYQYQKWLQATKQEDPNYLKFKYSTELVSPDIIQKKLLASNQALLEYFWGEEYLFTIAVSPKKITVQKQEIGALADSIRLLRTLALNPGWRSKIDASIHFQQLSHFVYERILGTLIQDLGEEYNKLIIVRDGLLEYLPFEMLDVSPETNPGILSPEDFLLNHYTIAYANSATLLELQNQHKNRKAKHFFAGFAPSYREMPDVADNAPLAYLTRSGLLELTGNKTEVTSIARLTGGETFIHERATEKHFKKNARDFSILHLALHALADDRRPGFSELLFTVPNPDPEEDGRLRAIELQHMQLNAQMAVLSGCSTGFGKLLRGEGVLSLSHAFTYAGVPGIVSSHWEADDENTAVIMTAFYRNLKKGMLKDEALTQAKIKFLETHREFAHPFYWATFVASGNMSVVEFPNPFWKYRLLLLVFLAVGVFIYRKHFLR